MIPADVYDFSGDLNALTVKVYPNGQRKLNLQIMKLID